MSIDPNLDFTTTKQISYAPVSKRRASWSGGVLK
jgi:hypothetical protein